MQIIGLNWLVIATTGSPASLGVTVLLHAVPKLLLGSWSGVLADRLPARPFIVASQTLHGLLAVALAVVAAGDASIPLVYCLSFLSGALATFDGPALARFASQVVPPERLGNALALGATVNSAGRIVGMSSAGVLIALTGAGTLFVLNALSFLAVIAAVLVIRTAETYALPASTPGNAGVRAGLRHLAGKPVLVLMLTLAFVMSSFVRNFQVTMAAMAQGPLSGGAVAYGALSTVFACGSVLGGLLAAHLRQLTVGVLFAGAVATSILHIVSGMMPGAVAFAALLMPISAGAVVVDTTLSTRMQLDSNGSMRGRVIATQSMVVGSGSAIGGPLLGWLCEAVGVRHTLALTGAVSIVAIVLVGAAMLHASRERQPDRAASPALPAGRDADPAAA